MRVGFWLFAGIFIALLLLGGCAALNAERTAPPVGQFIEVDGERLHVLERGKANKVHAPSIVLVHGASVNLRDMDIALGERLSEEFHVVMIDRPGRGYSTRPANGHQLNRQAGLIRDAVTSLGVERPVVVGQSFGGAVALAFALEFQNEMAGLVLLAPVSHEWPGGVAWYNAVSQRPVLGFMLRRLMIPVYGQFAGPGSTAASFAPDAPPEGYYKRAGVPLLFRAGDFRNNASDIYHLKSEIIAQQNRYGELDLPVAILTGDKDRTVSPAIHSKALASEIEGAKLTVLPETGHALHHAETETIIATIRAIAGRDETPRD